MRLPSDGRPRRSQHYAPGSSWHVMEKAAECAADSIILELEDGVAPEKKIEARANIVRALDEIDFKNKEVLVRINHLDTPWGKDDLAAIGAHPKVKGIVLPKVETRGYVEEVMGKAPGKELWLIYETTTGKREMPHILQSLKENGKIDAIRGMIFGNNDYSAQFPEVHADNRKHLLLQSARAEMLELAQGFGLVAMDGPSRNTIRDLCVHEEFKTDCQQGQKDGFDGKQTINLDQIRTVNETFSPTVRQLEEARALKAAYEAAREKEMGAVKIDGEMTEKMHYGAALQTLALGVAIAALGKGTGAVRAQ